MVPGVLGAQINGVKTIDAGEFTQEFESAVSDFLSLEEKYSFGRTATWENTDYQRQFDFGYVQHQRSTGLQQRQREYSKNNKSGSNNKNNSARTAKQPERENQ